MAEAGIKPGVLIERAGFSLQLYQKTLWPVANAIEFPNDDFIASVGTLFYRRRMGKAALAALFDDFASGGDVLRHLRGHFAVFVWHRQRLELFNDYNALYHLFSTAGGRFISSSFLAAAAASPTLTLSLDEIYEYLVYGAFYGSETLYREVTCLSGDHSYELMPAWREKPRSLRIEVPWRNAGVARDELVEIVGASLKDHFSILGDNFGDDICSALSGGFDSRLMLAILRNIGIKPKLYVYGADSGGDVAVARQICSGEGVPLDVIDKAKFRSPLDPAGYAKAFNEEFFAVDARNLEGAADDGMEALTRRRRLESARLNINGGGGEIYRDWWQLPPVPLSARSMAALTYERSYIPYYFQCTGKLEREAFFEKTGRKMAAAVGATENRLTRSDVEAVYSNYRLKYAVNLGYYPNNLLGSAVTPFIEPSLTQASRWIPLHFKRHAGFQMALIRHLDPEIAKYDSQHGYSFAREATGRRRLKNWLVILNRWLVKGWLPIPMLTKLYQSRIRPDTFPYYMKAEFTRELMGGDLEAVREYIDPSLIWDTAQMSRCITLEYLLRRFPAIVGS